MKNFITTIGIEVHTALNTKTKMFSRALNDHNAKPNTLVSFMDLALPGILPLVNKEAVNKAIILADALSMKINYQNIVFDRKNYFYPDLPKGFQITQQYNPIGQNGFVVIKDSNNKEKKIHIERIHMEEDTAKQTIVDNKRLMDYNRAGSPLIEIVTTPCINNGYEASQYLQELRKILVFKDISNAKMEEGSLRANVNISVRLEGQEEYGTKVEIKNINSINNVAKAIDYEINRQTSLLLNGIEVQQETRRFNDTNNTTEFMRSKTDAVDYRYMTEPNILHFQLSKKYVDELLKNAPKGHDVIISNLLKQGLDEKQINLLIDNHELYKLFNTISANKNINAKLVFNWVSVELVGLINKLGITINQIEKNKIDELCTLLELLDKQEINSKQAKTLLEKIFELNTSVTDLIKQLGFEQIKDKNILTSIIDKYIDSNQDLVKQYNERAERVEKFLVGMVMKDTNSQANPVITMELVKERVQVFLKK